MRRRRRIYIDESWRPLPPRHVTVLPPATAPPLAAEVPSAQGLKLRLTIEVPASAGRQAASLLVREIEDYQLNEPYRLGSLLALPGMDMVPLILRVRIVRAPPSATGNALQDGILAIRYRERPVPRTP